MDISYSVIVPVFNTGKILWELADRVGNSFQEMGIVKDFELILVDDYSPNPETWSNLLAIGDKYDFVKIIRLTRNFGQQAATLCGMSYAKGDYIVTMDDDLQHRPEELNKLLSEKQHDIVIGQLSQKKHSFWKRMGSKIKGYFDYLLIGKPKHIQLSSYRLINRTVVDGMLKIQTPNPFIPALMFYISKDIVGANVTHDYRKEGKTTYNLGKMIKVFSNLIINNSSFLLKFIGNIGLFISIASFLIGIFFIFKKIFYGIPVVGWTSVIVTLLFIGGLLLFVIGIIGEYLIRIISGVERKPTYVVRDKLNFNEE